MSSPRETQAGYMAVCSRGLIHSRTAEVISKIQEFYGYVPRYTHDLPIPDAQNQIVQDILKDRNAEFILFIEEDIVPEWDFLDSAHPAHPVQCVDYRLEGGTSSIHYDAAGNILFCGMGCLLVAADVFRKLPYPWFTDREFSIDKDGQREILIPSAGQKQYGGQDISFCYSLQKAHLPIHLIPGIAAQHLRVTQAGARGVNSGCHVIDAL